MDTIEGEVYNIMDIMNFMKAYIHILLGAFLLQSCNQSNVTPFERNVDIIGRVAIGGDSLLDPWGIHVQEDILVIANLKGEPLIETYDITADNPTLISKFGVLGDGPEEFLGGESFQKGLSASSFIVYDLFKNKFFEYSIPELRENKERPMQIYPFQQHVLQKDSTTVLSDLLLLNGNSVIGRSRDMRGRIVIFDREGNVLRFGGDYPMIAEYQNLSDYEYTGLFASDIVYNEERGKIAMTAYEADMLDIFDISNDTICPIWSYRTFLPNHLYLFQTSNGNARSAFTKDSDVGYLSLTSSKRYIYALFSGKTMGTKNYMYSNIIRVVDWEGKESFQIHTEDFELKRIAVSEDDRYIYGIAQDDEGDPIIVAYDITSVFL